MPRLESRVQDLADGEGNPPIILLKVNVDNFGEIASALGVSTIPHVFLVKGGELVDQFVGGVEDSRLDEFFANVIGN